MQSLFLNIFFFFSKKNMSFIFNLIALKKQKPSQNNFFLSFFLYFKSLFCFVYFEIHLPCYSAHFIHISFLMTSGNSKNWFHFSVSSFLFLSLCFHNIFIFIFFFYFEMPFGILLLWANVSFQFSSPELKRWSCLLLYC